MKKEQNFICAKGPGEMEENVRENAGPPRIVAIRKQNCTQHGPLRSMKIASRFFLFLRYSDLNPTISVSGGFGVAAILFVQIQNDTKQKQTI